MGDLVPLLVFVAGVLLHIVFWFGERRSRPGMASPQSRRVLIVISGLVVLLPYLTFALFPKEPDVRDFYTSVWFVPQLVLGGAAIRLMWGLSRPTRPDRLGTAV